ncbi:hypothetical protein DPMN_013163 [Dreissena polymorpha]|uniref:Uncharacterized protein n=1 Tax=Dreissena polymorpha TaxID=45954 RepID=A0A9D4N8F9_DREPO|nr:hypothetical protein DPMN_013163 [Dreissena polymorpha]
MLCQFDIKKNCAKLYPNVKLNVELEFHASSTFENKRTTLYPNVKLNVELECRVSTTFGLNVELNVELECHANSTFKNNFQHYLRMWN